jgi:hypothetical protein
MLQGGDVKKLMPICLRFYVIRLHWKQIWLGRVRWHGGHRQVICRLRFLCVTWQCSQTHTFSFWILMCWRLRSVALDVRHNQNRGEFSMLINDQEGWYLHDVISITGRESFVDQNRTTWAYHRSQLDPDPHSDYELLKARSALDSYSASRHYKTNFDKLLSTIMMTLMVSSTVAIARLTCIVWRTCSPYTLSFMSF